MSALASAMAVATSERVRVTRRLKPSWLGTPVAVPLPVTVMLGWLVVTGVAVVPLSPEPSARAASTTATRPITPTPIRAAIKPLRDRSWAAIVFSFASGMKSVV